MFRRTEKDRFTGGQDTLVQRSTGCSYSTPFPPAEDSLCQPCLPHWQAKSGSEAAPTFSH